MIKSDSECEFGKFCAVVLLAHFINNNNKRNRTQKPEIQGGRRKEEAKNRQEEAESGDTHNVFSHYFILSCSLTLNHSHSVNIYRIA